MALSNIIQTIHERLQRRNPGGTQRTQGFTQAVQSQTIDPQGATNIYDAFEYKYLALLEKIPRQQTSQVQQQSPHQPTFAMDALRHLQSIGLIAKPTIETSPTTPYPKPKTKRKSKEQGQETENKAAMPKFPPMGYPLFQKENYTIIKEEFHKQSEVNNFSVFTANYWRALPMAKKKEYYDRAKQLLEEFKINYPKVYKERKEQLSQKSQAKKSLKRAKIVNGAIESWNQYQQPQSAITEPKTIMSMPSNNE